MQCVPGRALVGPPCWWTTPLDSLPPGRQSPHQVQLHVQHRFASSHAVIGVIASIQCRRFHSRSVGHLGRVFYTKNRPVSQGHITVGHIRRLAQHPPLPAICTCGRIPASARLPSLTVLCPLGALLLPPRSFCSTRRAHLLVFLAFSGPSIEPSTE